MIRAYRLFTFRPAHLDSQLFLLVRNAVHASSSQNPCRKARRMFFETARLGLVLLVKSVVLSSAQMIGKLSAKTAVCRGFHDIIGHLALVEDQTECAK